MKRHLFRLVLFLILGAIINVAVAWGCAQLIPYPLIKQELRDSDLSIWRVQMRTGWPSEPYHRMSATAFGKRYEVMSGRIDFANASAPPGWLKGIYKEWRDGWPLPCLARHTRLSFGKNIPSGYGFAAGQEERGLVVPPQNGMFAGLRELRLPIEPVWPGFAVNTFFYAAIVWSLTLGPFTARRIIRRKRGRCIKCGYDLGHADHRVCPECGADGSL